MTEPALWISLLSLILAAMSAGWQIASWLLGGRRVKVVLRHGVAGQAGVVAGPVPRGGGPNQIEMMRSQGFHGPELLGIDVINVGRLPVIITEYSVIAVNGKMSFVPHGDSIGPELPYRLEAGDAATWYVNIEDARALVQAHRATGTRVAAVQMTARLGTKQERRTKRSLAIL